MHELFSFFQVCMFARHHSYVMQPQAERTVKSWSPWESLRWKLTGRKQKSLSCTRTHVSIFAVSYYYGLIIIFPACQWVLFQVGSHKVHMSPKRVCAESWLGEKKTPSAAPGEIEPASAFLLYHMIIMLCYYLSNTSVHMVSGWLSHSCTCRKDVKGSKERLLGHKHTIISN